MPIGRICLAALLSLVALPARGQGSFDIKTVDPATFRAIAHKITGAERPDIDGRLTDEAWALAPAQGNFIQREPSYGAPSSEKTEFRILYDDRAIYIGVWVWDSDPAGIMGSEMKRDAGLNKGEASNSLRRAVFFHRQGEIRDRTFENQSFRASGLSLITAAIVHWNTVYLDRTVQHLRAQGVTVPDDLLAHVAPLGWEHIALTGDYVWTDRNPGAPFRPLRAGPGKASERAPAPPLTCR